jgi:hypothetical protein
MNREFNRWKAQLEAAALRVLGPRAEGADRDSYRVYAAPCPEHGDACARVVYGVLLNHFAWQTEDPERLAEQLSRTMLPAHGDGEPQP